MSSDDVNHIEKLRDHKNFPMWKFQIEVMFKANDYFEIVKGESIFDDSKTADVKSSWKKKDAKAQKLIVLSVDNKNVVHIMNCETSRDMYEKLCKLYQQDNEQQKCKLLQEFFDVKYDKASNLASHISKIENIVYSLKSLKEVLSDEMVVSKIITTLPEIYSSFISAWESVASNERTLENLISRLLTEEQRRNARENNQSNQSVAFKTSENRCFKCNGLGHFARQCKKNVKCYNCQQMGHIEKNCKLKNRDKSGTNKKCGICRKTNHDEKDCYFRDKQKVSFLVSENKLNNNEVSEWVLDSGSSSHMTNNKQLLSDIDYVECDIGVAKINEKMKSEAKGVFENEQCVLKDVLYVPELTKNLLSVNAITRNGGTVKFARDKVEVVKDKSKVFDGTLSQSGLYIVKIKPSLIKSALIIESENNVQDWHCKLGHLGKGNMKSLVNMSRGMNLSKSELDDFDSVCETCVNAKQTRTPFTNERCKAKRPLEIIHTDICGPIDPETWDEKRYFITFIDEFTHFVMIFLLSNKYEAIDIIKNYINEVEAKWNLKVSKFRSDNGGEYINTVLCSWLLQKGIVHDMTIPYTPQLNGTAERMNRTIMERARALIMDRNSDKMLWGEAVLTAGYLINRSPTKCLDCTPSEKWHQVRPNLSNLKIFGSIVFAKVLSYRKKLDNRSEKYIFVGYATNGYRLFNPYQRKIIISRDVVFSNQRIGKISCIHDNPEMVKFSAVDMDENDVDVPHMNDASREENSEDQDEEKCANDRPQRNRKQPTRYDDYVLLTYAEAISGPDKDKWQAAIDEEISSLEQNKTWTYVDKKETNGVKILSSKWVFKIKDDGRYKARLVIRGCEQQCGVNFEDTFSPVITTSALRIILAVANKRKNKILKFDVKTAFLYGELNDVIFMYPPEGFDNNLICKLNKSLYGLKQAPLNWNQRFTEFLMKHDMHPMKTEKCVFKSGDGSLILALYVDDGLIVGEDEVKIRQLIDDMENEFEIVISENPNSFLGIEIQQRDGKLTLTQTNYAKSIIERFRMEGAKPAKVPMMKSGEANGESTEMHFPYREAIGSLLYLTTKTRPDMSFSVNYCSRFMECPKQQNVNDVKHVLRFLNGTLSSGISYNSVSNIDNINAFCDSDFAGDLESRRSTTGYIIFYCGGPIAWCSRKQPIVATSSSEAEYIAAADCVKELIYLKAFIEELLSIKINVELNVDNQSAIQMIKSGICNKRSKHIDVKYHFINEKFNEGIFKVKYCSSNEQIADCFTKPLNEVKFKCLSDNFIV